MQAAQGHANYYIAHLDDPNSGGLHTQVFGYSGFTGRTIGDRARAAGYPLGWVDEVFAFFAPSRTPMAWALDTVWHRYMFIHPSAVHVGYGTATGGGRTITVVQRRLVAGGTPPDAPTSCPSFRSTVLPTCRVSWAGWEVAQPGPRRAAPVRPPPFRCNSG